MPWIRNVPVWARIVIAAVLLLGVGLGVALVLRHSNGSQGAPSPGPSSSAIPPVAAPSESVPASGMQPGDVIATVKAEGIDVFAAPSDATRASTLSQWSAYFQPRTLLAVDEKDIDGTRWLMVKLPVQPNGSTGWIRAEDAELNSTSKRIDIYLDDLTLELSDDGVVVFNTPVAAGAAATPTPPGLYYVTDPLPYANPNGVYGAYALGLSGFSEVLDSFDGQPPQLAIHGTNKPELIGQAVSNGCIRLPNDAVLTLAGQVGLGTPVIIHATHDS